MRLSKIHVGAWSAALATAAIFGISTPIAKLVVETVPPFIVLFLRFTLAGFIFLPFFWRADFIKPIQTKDFFRLALFGFLGSTVATGAAFEGIARTDALDAAVILATIPLIEALGAAIVFREQFSRLQKIGFLLGILGTLVVIGAPLAILTLSSQEKILGNILVFASNLAFVAFSLGSKTFFHRYSPTHVAGMLFSVGMITTAPIAIFQYLQGNVWVADATMVTFSGILFLAIATTIFAHVFWEIALSRSSPGKVGLALYTTPIFAGLVAIPLFGERPGLIFLLGSVLILAGVILGLRGTHEKLHTLRRTRHS